MSYPYTRDNILEKPQSYMYAKFQGAELLKQYGDSRKEYCALETRYDGATENLLLEHANTTLKSYCALALSDAIPARTALREIHIPLSNFSLEKEITTKELIESVVSSLLLSEDLSKDDYGNAKHWLDRVVQRFEVSKKLYATYAPGFRKGSGESDDVTRYWLFALALSVYYANSQEIKYLSTLLKVCDLLCSLRADTLRDNIPPSGLLLVLSVESKSIEKLCGAKGVSVDFI